MAVSIHQTAPTSYRVQNALALATIALVGIIIYANSLQGGFLSDDFDWFFLVESPTYSPFDVMTTAGTGLYFRPLITLSLRLEQAIAGGVSPFIHHLSNLLIHLANGGLVYLACNAINHRPRLSLGLALLFLLHPAVVPDVYWIAARVDSLMTLFYLLGILGYLYFLQSSQPTWLILIAAGFAGSLLTKEMAVTFPLLLLLFYLLFKLELFPGAPLPPRPLWAWPPLIAFFLATAAYLLYLYTRFYRPAGQTFPPFSPLTALEASLASFILLLYPNNQSSLITLYRSYPWLLVLGLALLAAVLLFGAIWLYRQGGRRSFLLAALLAALYLATLPPLLISGVESRQLYLPLAVLCLALAFLPHLRPSLAGRVAWLLYPLALLLAILSYQHGRVWSENSQLAQSYCHSFRTLTPTLTQDSPILLLTIPAESRHVPVFANDINAALFHCRFGRFGYFPRLTYVGSLITPQAAPAPNAILLTQEQEAIHISLPASEPPARPAAAAYFYFGPNIAPGDRLVADQNDLGTPMSVTINTLNGRDQVAAFTFTLTPLPDAPPIEPFYFTGSQFTRLP